MKAASVEVPRVFLLLFFILISLLFFIYFIYLSFFCIRLKRDEVISTGQSVLIRDNSKEKKLIT